MVGGIACSAVNFGNFRMLARILLGSCAEGKHGNERSLSIVARNSAASAWAMWSQLKKHLYFVNQSLAEVGLTSWHC